MARIRSIKPEFWTSEQVLECSPNARLLFIGLWNFCDDKGRHPSSAKQAKAEIFPADDISLGDVEALINELASNGLITLYVVDNKGYLSVNGWEHQRIDKPQKPKYPAPDDGDILEHSKNTLGTFHPDTIGKERKGKERKGEDMEITPQAACAHSDEAREIVSYLNNKTGASLRHCDGTTKLVSARINDGATVDEIKRVIDLKCSEWLNDKKMHVHLVPKTLLRKSNYDTYAGMLSVETPEQRNHREMQAWIDERTTTNDVTAHARIGSADGSSFIEGEAIRHDDR